ncbi:hypothetical protein AAHC03_013782 [Spirometra sp. Aus1]
MVIKAVRLKSKLPGSRIQTPTTLKSQTIRLVEHVNDDCISDDSVEIEPWHEDFACISNFQGEVITNFVAPLEAKMFPAPSSAMSGNLPSRDEITFEAAQRQGVPPH